MTFGLYVVYLGNYSWGARESYGHKIKGELRPSTGFFKWNPTRQGFLSHLQSSFTNQMVNVSSFNFISHLNFPNIRRRRGRKHVRVWYPRQLCSYCTVLYSYQYSIAGMQTDKVRHGYTLHSNNNQIFLFIICKAWYLCGTHCIF